MIDGHRKDFDEDLSGTGFGNGDIHDLQDLGTTVFANLGNLHGGEDNAPDAICGGKLESLRGDFAMGPVSTPFRPGSASESLVSASG